MIRKARAVGVSKTDHTGGWHPSVLARLWHAQGGSAILEFAFIGPMFIGLLMACLYTALAYLAQQSLETAAEDAARLLLTGQAQTLQYYDKSSENTLTGMTAAQFRQAICGQLTYNTSASPSSATKFGGSLLPPVLACDRLIINVNPATSYAGANLTAPTLQYDANGNLKTTDTFNPIVGNSGQGNILVVQLIYLWPTVGGGLGFNLTDQPHGNFLLVATQVITAEPYACPAGVTSC